MKYASLLIIILGLLFSNCKNDNYKRLIDQENKLLILQLEITYGRIEFLNDKNAYKYGPWKSKCDNIMKLVETVKNNLNDLEVLKSSCEKLEKESNWSIRDGFSWNDSYRYRKIQDSLFLELDFNPNNEVETALFVNKFLTISNINISRILFESNIRDWRTTNLKQEFLLNKSSYFAGEDIEGKIFFSYADTTCRPIIKIENNITVDTFDKNGKGIYKFKNYKKGIHEIKGYMLFQHDFWSEADTFPIYTKYTIK